MSLRYQYHPNALRLAYREYLKVKYPKLSLKSLNTKVDDAFCMFRWLPEEEAWQRVQERGGSLESQRQFLADEFLSHRKNPMKDAGGYIRAVKEFQSFLDLVGLVEDSRKLIPRVIQVDD